MKARKDNKAYQITEHQKNEYLADGYDVYEDNGEITYSPLKKITLQEHTDAIETLRKELEGASDNTKEVAELKAKVAELESTIKSTEAPVTAMDSLCAYAQVKKIEVGSATSARGVLEKILVVEKE